MGYSLSPQCSGPTTSEKKRHSSGSLSLLIEPFLIQSWIDGGWTLK
ncbi:hypothetical protein HMPREF9348_05352 [Escherichia coli MS 145-7]|nr:hypothetical protein HMPREF9348_05352 [Escherichia coli MS 145-7]